MKNSKKGIAEIIIKFALALIGANVMFSAAVDCSDNLSGYFFLVAFVIATISNLCIRKFAGDNGLDENDFAEAVGINMMVMLISASLMFLITGMKDTFVLSSIAITGNMFLMMFAQNSIFSPLERKKKVEDLWWTKPHVAGGQRKK